MAVGNCKIKLTRLNEGNDSLSPQLSLNFKPINKSYDILSVLKGNNDLVIEVNSSLFFGPSEENEKLVNHLLDKIKNMGLYHTYRKMPVPAKQSFITQLFSGGNKMIDAHEILAYIPGSAWSDEAFRQILQDYMIRFYVLEKSNDPEELISKISGMSDSEKKQYFKLIIFIAPQFNQMGITGDHLSEQDIRRMLGI
jgi:hypothetical protein